MPLSDSSATFMQALWPKPSPAALLLVGSRSLRGLPVLVHEASRRVWVFDYAGPDRNSRYRSAHIAFRHSKSVGILIASFRSLIPSPPVPLFTLRRTPRGVQRKTRGRAVRYSFLVGLFHSLLHAGLSRRTGKAIMHSLNRRLEHHTGASAVLFFRKANRYGIHDSRTKSSHEIGCRVPLFSEIAATGKGWCLARKIILRMLLTIWFR
jgi:hypothetical protein